MDPRAVATELERYWVEQSRRAKEICDLLERHVRDSLGLSPQLGMLRSSDESGEAEPEHRAERRRPALRLVRLDPSKRS